MKKALFISLNGNKIVAGDIFALGSGFEKMGFENHYLNLGKNGALDQVESLPIEEFDAIFIPFVFVAKFDSGGSRASAFKNIFSRAKPGSISTAFCDTTFPLDPFLWDEKFCREKTNVWKLGPVKVLGSFNSLITGDRQAMAKIKGTIMDKIHGDSQFIPIEWNAFHLNTKEKDIVESREDFKKLNLKLPEKINRFYYGIHKKRLVPSLRRMKLGEDSLDRTFGKISVFFPSVENITPSQAVKNPRLWVSYADAAEFNLYPYDPVKGDYQFTLRNLELALIGKDKITVDPRVSDYIQSFFDLEEWNKKEKEVLREFKTLY